MSRIRRFFVEAWQELKKVNWPTPEQARNLTVLVLAVSLVVGLYIAFFDVIFGAIAKALNAG
ncbi:MAG TPA: preprotein translocase subunit SecE [Candidatus Limnocylindrales bacterium]|nr:preprotein translocase subunit SecE [Candidatus Limnocylindrales bacterium]